MIHTIVPHNPIPLITNNYMNYHSAPQPQIHGSSFIPLISTHTHALLASLCQKMNVVYKTIWILTQPKHSTNNSKKNTKCTIKNWEGGGTQLLNTHKHKYTLSQCPPSTMFSAKYPMKFHRCKASILTTRLYPLTRMTHVM